MKMEMQPNSLWHIFPEMSQFSDRIYLGRCTDAEDVELLLSKGITAVANLTQDDFIIHEGIKTLKLGQDDSVAISTQTLKKFLSWMDEAWAEGHTILIHCHAGISRSPSFLIFWLMHRQRCNKDSDLSGEWSFFEDAIGAVRPIIQPHYELKRSIIRYFESIAA